jgi:hypothetical protein
VEALTCPHCRRDQGHVYAPNGQPLFYIADGCFYDASGAAVLHFDADADDTTLPDLADSQEGIVHGIAAAIDPAHWSAFLQRVAVLLRAANCSTNSRPRDCSTAIEHCLLFGRTLRHLCRM